MMILIFGLPQPSLCETSDEVKIEEKNGYVARDQLLYAL